MPDLDELLTDEPSWAAASHAHPPAFAELQARAVRRRRTRRAAYAAGVAAVAAAVGLGLAVLPGGESSPEPAPPIGQRTEALIELVDRVLVTAESADFVVVDFTEAKEALGLPARALPGERAPEGASEAEQEAWRELLATTLAVPHLNGPGSEEILDAIDGGQITAAANTMYRGGGGAITVLRTGQDFDSIAAGLERAGYVRDGTLLTYEGDPPAPSRYMYFAGANGLVAISSDRDGAHAVQVAVGSEPPPRSEEGDLLARIHAETNAPGLMLISDLDDDCDRAVIGVETFGGEDELVLVGPDRAAVNLSDLSGLGTPVMDGELLRLAVGGQFPVRGYPAGPFAMLTSGLDWRCG